MSTTKKAPGHGLPSLFSAIVNLRTTVRNHLEATIGGEQRAAELRHGAEIRSSPTFLNHLARLGQAEKVESAEISYSFDFATRTLKPILEPNGAAQDTIVCTVALGDDYRRKIRPCLDSHQAYCRRHGYAYARLESPPSHQPRHPSWYKIPLVHGLMRRGHRRIFYIDADALITNPDISLEPFFEPLSRENKTLHLAEDDGGVNMGVFFMTNTPDAIRLLDLLWTNDLGLHRPTWEQAALKDLLNHYVQVRKVVSLSPSATAFNSFPRERAELAHAGQENDWSRGDFICHFSGIRSPALEELIARYLA